MMTLKSVSDLHINESLGVAKRSSEFDLLEDLSMTVNG
jgi:hypothetical protein